MEEETQLGIFQKYHALDGAFEPRILNLKPNVTWYITDTKKGRIMWACHWQQHIINTLEEMWHKHRGTWSMTFPTAIKNSGFQGMFKILPSSSGDRTKPDIYMYDNEWKWNGKEMEETSPPKMVQRKVYRIDVTPTRSLPRTYYVDSTPQGYYIPQLPTERQPRKEYIHKSTHKPIHPKHGKHGDDDGDGGAGDFLEDTTPVPPHLQPRPQQHPPTHDVYIPPQHQWIEYVHEEKRYNKLLEWAKTHKEKPPLFPLRPDDLYSHYSPEYDARLGIYEDMTEKYNQKHPTKPWPEAMTPSRMVEVEKYIIHEIVNKIRGEAKPTDDYEHVELHIQNRVDNVRKECLTYSAKIWKNLGNSMQAYNDKWAEIERQVDEDVKNHKLPPPLPDGEKWDDVKDDEPPKPIKKGANNRDQVKAINHVPKGPLPGTIPLNPTQADWDRYNKRLDTYMRRVEYAKKNNMTPPFHPLRPNEPLNWESPEYEQRKAVYKRYIKEYNEKHPDTPWPMQTMSYTTMVDMEKWFNEMYVNEAKRMFPKGKEKERMTAIQTHVSTYRHQLESYTPDDWVRDLEAIKRSEGEWEDVDFKREETPNQKRAREKKEKREKGPDEDGFQPAAPYQPIMDIMNVSVFF